MKLLLLSNSRSPDQQYLEHALTPIQDLCQERREAVFVPFAAVTEDWKTYGQKVQAALSRTQLRITTLAASDNLLGDADLIAKAEVLIVGGGNTYHLLKHCRERDVLYAIKNAVARGTPYVGWSAGANLACRTIATTNDMPIVDPSGFDALDLIAFQINPHYTNAQPDGHLGETRNQRIAEYLAANPDRVVLGLPEGTYVRTENDRHFFSGNGVTRFRQGHLPEPVFPGKWITNRTILT